MLRKLFLCLLIAALLPVSAFASGTEQTVTEGIDPEEGLPTEALESIGNYDDFSAASFTEALFRLLGDTLSGLGGSLKEGILCSGAILAAVLLCGITETAEHAADMSRIVGALAITAICTGSLTSMVNLGTKTVRQINDYGLLLLPGMSALAVASGGSGKGTAVFFVSSLFFKFLMSMVGFLIIPGIAFLAAISAAEAALANEKLTKLRQFLQWLLTGTLKCVLYVFTGFLTLTGIISGTCDSVRLKAAKLALSGAVPVVGGILSDASETLLTSAAVLRNSVGTYGLLAVLALCLYPFTKVLLQYLLLKATTAVSGLLGQKQHVTLLDNLSSAMGLTAGTVGTFAVMMLISLTLFINLSG